jgi:hypothetical protein
LYYGDEIKKGEIGCDMQNAKEKNENTYQIYFKE